MKKNVGRPRKFKLGDIVTDLHTDYVIVDHQLRGTKSEYRVVPLNRRYERYGRAAWRNSAEFTATDVHSSSGSLVTYRANRKLEEELPGGRGCACECCVHTAIPRDAFNKFTGEMKDDDG